MGDGSGRLGMFFVFVLGWVGLGWFGSVWFGMSFFYCWMGMILGVDRRWMGS